MRLTSKGSIAPTGLDLLSVGRCFGRYEYFEHGGNLENI